MTTFSRAKAVTEHDTNTIQPCRALWVGEGGSLVVTMAGGGNDVTIAAVPGGAFIPISVTKVKTASTAGSIIALY